MVFVNTSIISEGLIELKNHKAAGKKVWCHLRTLSSKKWSNLNYPLLILVSYTEFGIYILGAWFLPAENWLCSLSIEVLFQFEHLLLGLTGLW